MIFNHNYNNKYYLTKKNARVNYNSINPKEEGFDPNDIKETAPKIFEKLLDMDNPTFNEELYQILIDYDGIASIIYIFHFLFLINKNIYISYI